MGVWLSWDEVNNACQGKKVVLFGYGNRADSTIKYLQKDIAYIVDNNPYSWKDGVYPPETVIADKENTFVIITTTGFRDVIGQLKSYGVENFCVSPVLQDFEVLSRILDHEQTIYLTSSDQVDNGGGVYRLSLQSGKLERLFRGHCHGIVEGDEYIYVIDDSIGGIRVLNKDFGHKKVLSLPKNCRPHGIAYSEGRIAVAYSGRDSVGIFRASGDGTEEIEILKFSPDTPQGHINDVCMCQGKLYFTAFSLSGNWKRGIYDGALAEVTDFISGSIAILVQGLWLPHTPTVINSTLHYCESMQGRVWAGDRRLVVEFNGFVRGLAHDGQFYYVGQSQHRHITRRLGAKNISLDTGVFIVDDKTKATKFFPTLGITDINSILVRRQDCV